MELPRPTLLHKTSGRSAGAALISILLLMALMVILVIAIVLLAQSEMRSSAVYENQISSQDLSEVATNLVISQLRSGTVGKSETWASQPGAIRKYDSRGDFLAGYKLFSDDDMIIDDEKEFLEDLPPGNWQQETQHFVDLNQPSRMDSDLVFPIIDPRARGTVEGFDISETIEGTVLSEDTSARLPMPVRWLYMLEDGTTGHLDPKTGKFTGVRANGERVIPDKDNPIVGRIAFWTDDECAKLNINTASEPTFWDTPKSVSREDLWYGRAQPTQKEYQRFPGHPATTALSPVLFGNEVERKTIAELDGDTMRTSRSLSRDMRKNSEIKEIIYDLVPRVNTGGSRSATQVNRRGDPGVEPDDDRLYASVDEFIFKAPRLQTQKGKRETSEIVSRDLLEKSRFFLTAHSRAPELNLYGLPRVSIWPTTADEKSNQYLTGFDNLIRFCSTTSSGHPYYFTRMNSDSPTDDWRRISRNREVYDYLKQLTSQPVPGVGKDFASKFDEDHEQILTEIFDYVRTTNLFDDNHPKLFYTGQESSANKQTQFTNGRTLYWSNGELKENFNGTHQGHGQVAPIQIGDTMGFGRFPTFSEFTLALICCASPGDSPRPQKTGGERIVDSVPIKLPPGYKGGTTRIHYTNFPPLHPLPKNVDVRKLPPEKWPYQPVRDRNNRLRFSNDPAHPGYDPLNWNHALPVWKSWHTGLTDPTNCKKEEIVVQLCVISEAFIPGQGWSSINSRLRTHWTGLNSLRINNEDLGLQPLIRKNRAGSLSSGFHGRAWGGNAGFRGNTDFSFVSEPIKIDISSGKIEFSQKEPVILDVFCEHNGYQSQAIQRIHLRFPDAEFPIPVIQKEGSRTRAGKPETSARFWWSFNNSKVNNARNFPETDPRPDIPWHMNGQALVEGRKKSRTGRLLQTDKLIGAYYWGGRLTGKGSNPGSPWTVANNHSEEAKTLDPRWRPGVHKGGFWKEGDVLRSLTPFHGRGNQVAGGDFRLVAASRDVNVNVFRPHAGYFNHADPIDHTLFLPAGAHYYWRFGNADLHKTPDGFYPKFNYPVETQLTDASYHFSKFPDFPRGYSSPEGMTPSKPIATGDFDNGVALTVDGPYLNKPDGGNRSNRWGVSRGDAFSDVPTPYFDNNWGQAIQGPGYFSPNRQISSPVMFGSLPTGVKRELPWQTLLFRPQTWGHPADSGRPHPGSEGLKDHYLLDLFWMPVVEPYAISEPFSTAGKINLNYQIIPFTNVKRATGLHGVMKAEEMLIISDQDAAHYKNWDHALADYYVPPLPSQVQLRHLIDIDETLKQFDDRFLNGEIFRSATEICEMHLIPMRDRPGMSSLNIPEPQEGKKIQPRVDQIMKTFWAAHSPTGDNSRERPYSNLYPRLTTKSNTFRIHARVQVVKKARDSDHETFDPDKDTIAGEWRGETLLERYIDPNNSGIPDYAKSGNALNKENLDRFYQYRILYQKRFEG